MATLTITEYLKYIDLQTTAEAFLVDSNNKVLTGEKLENALKKGNNHATKFTTERAKEFLTEWEIVEQRPNTETGFSGTVFRHKITRELVLSFRSTEFIDDAIRDSASTNTLEIKDTGFAWGQLSDMESWFAELNAVGGTLHGQQYSVTGYSLGGHLATAFHKLRHEEGTADSIKEVVTFNGAGVGLVAQGSLTSALDNFERYSAAAFSPSFQAASDELLAALDLTTTGLQSLFVEMRAKLNNATWTEQQALDTLADFVQQADNFPEDPDSAVKQEVAILQQALEQIVTLKAEAERIKNFSSGTGQETNDVEGSDIIAYQLDYRLAALLSGKVTQTTNLKKSNQRIAA